MSSNERLNLQNRSHQYMNGNKNDHDMPNDMKTVASNQSSRNDASKHRTSGPGAQNANGNRYKQK